MLIMVSRYYGFADYALGYDKARLKIMPRPGRAPPKLPQWLRIPYLVPVKGVRLRVKLEGHMNSCLQGGDPLYQEDNGTHVGTLGIIMVSKDTHVALTAGHILTDEDRKMVVREYTDDESPIFTQRVNDEPGVELKIATYSVRKSGRPLGRLKEDPGFQDDCAFLRIDRDDVAKFEPSILCVDPHLFARRSMINGEMNAGDPLSRSRRTSIKKRIGTEGLIVFKQGASTGLTMGLLIEINDSPPGGWYVNDDESEVDSDLKYIPFERDKDDKEELQYYDKDPNEWLGLVKWQNGCRFAAPGDSGSLVFAKVKNTIIPLGIHVGSPQSIPEHSIFISLDTFCFEAEKEGWELRLTQRY